MADTNISAKRGNGKRRKKHESSIREMRAEFQAAQDEIADEKPKKRYVKPLILLFVLLLIGGGGGGAWMFLQPADDETVAAEDVAPPEVPKAYIETQPVHIAFEPANGHRQRLIVYLTLEVEQRDGNVSQVQHAMPKLQEAFWRTLNAEPLPGADAGSIELTAVKERIREESERLLGSNIVSDVLIRKARQIRG